MSANSFILASGSTSRRSILEAAGVPFTGISSELDEDSIKETLLAEGADGATIAHTLAEAKAFAVSQRQPDAIVLGADQILVCGERIFSKAQDVAEARSTLEALRGRDHELVSATVLARNGVLLWVRTDVARLTMRVFSDAFLEEYIAAEMPDILNSVGCYRIEGRGALLFSSVKGEHFSIRGLPLIPVLEALREFGALPP